MANVIITNGGFETGDLTGWTVLSGNQAVRNTTPPGPTTGQFFLSYATVAISSIEQIVDIDVAEHAAIDLGNKKATLDYMQASFTTDAGYIDIEPLDAVGVLIQSGHAVEETYIAPDDTWQARSRYILLPKLTRKIRITVYNNRHAGTQANSYFDDLQLNVVDNAGSAGIQNPGFDTGDISGWNVDVGSVLENPGSVSTGTTLNGVHAHNEIGNGAPAPHAGTHYVMLNNRNRAAAQINQLVELSAQEKIDVAANGQLKLQWYRNSYSGSDLMTAELHVYNEFNEQIAHVSAPGTAPSGWTLQTLTATGVAAASRYIIVFRGTLNAGSAIDVYIDTISMQVGLNTVQNASQALSTTGIIRKQLDLATTASIAVAMKKDFDNFSSASAAISIMKPVEPNMMLSTAINVIAKPIQSDFAQSLSNITIVKKQQDNSAQSMSQIGIMSIGAKNYSHATSVAVVASKPVNNFSNALGTISVIKNENGLCQSNSIDAVLKQSKDYMLNASAISVVKINQNNNNNIQSKSLIAIVKDTVGITGTALSLSNVVIAQEAGYFQNYANAFTNTALMAPTVANYELAASVVAIAKIEHGYALGLSQAIALVPKKDSTLNLSSIAVMISTEPVLSARMTSQIVILDNPLIGSEGDRFDKGGTNYEEPANVFSKEQKSSFVNLETSVKNTQHKDIDWSDNG